MIENVGILGFLDASHEKRSAHSGMMLAEQLSTYSCRSTDPTVCRARPAGPTTREIRTWNLATRGRLMLAAYLQEEYTVLAAFEIQMVVERRLEDKHPMVL